jgi:DNA (cytosine-5)-methyltransferase 1
MGKQKKKILSLFSGGGGLDLGFEGGFEVIQEAINDSMTPDWVEDTRDGWVLLNKTPFETVFANDIAEPAFKAWDNYFGSKRDVRNAYHLASTPS